MGVKKVKGKRKWRGEEKKKLTSGEAVAYISRSQAIKKLQLSLADFRRLCILKGIYPREPKHKKKVNMGNSQHKTYFLLNDIRFLSHESIITKFRDTKVFMKKLQRAKSKKNSSAVTLLVRNKPSYELDHIVKERYPTFIDALREADDCISMCFLFASMPRMRQVGGRLIDMARRLTVEFMNYVILSKCLQKTFLSIKGIYYQVQICGQSITWIVPHARGFQVPTEVDLRIMQTFVEFYITLLGFINFKSYHDLNLYYPPKLSLSHTREEDGEKMERSLSMPDTGTGDPVEEFEYLASLVQPIHSLPTEPDHPLPDIFDENQSTDTIDKRDLFKPLKVFLNREVPRESLTFLLRCLGGDVSWCPTVADGSTFKEEDETITHQIVDRPNIRNKRLNRLYVQPQWVFDCVNRGELIAPEKYFPGQILPPHLSPFVDNTDYQPSTDAAAQVWFEKRFPALEKEEEELKTSKKTEESSDTEVEDTNGDADKDNDEDTAPVVKKRKVLVKKGSGDGAAAKIAAQRKQETEEGQQKRMQEMMLGKKEKRLYKKIMFSKKKKRQEIEKLKSKREIIEKLNKSATTPLTVHSRKHRVNKS